MGKAFKLDDRFPKYAAQVLAAVDAKVVPNESVAHVGKAFKLDDRIPARAVQPLDAGAVPNKSVVHVTKNIMAMSHGMLEIARAHHVAEDQRRGCENAAAFLLEVRSLIGSLDSFDGPLDPVTCATVGRAIRQQAARRDFCLVDIADAVLRGIYEAPPSEWMQRARVLAVFTDPVEQTELANVLVDLCEEAGSATRGAKLLVQLHAHGFLLLAAVPASDKAP